MISDFKGKTAVLTGAGSGFGLECARIGAARGMNLVLVDVQQDALDAARAEMEKAGAQVLARKVDVSDAGQMEALAAAVKQRFGAPHFVFNNAGVGSGGLVWENTVADWNWVLGVDLMGVVHGVRLFVPMMLEAAAKAAVVSLTETMYQDLRLVTDQVGASLLCPYFVPTGIAASERNRPGGAASEKLTKSQLIGKAMSEKAVSSGKVTAAEVAGNVFRAIETDQFYVYSHPKALGNVKSRMEGIVAGINPADPFLERPEIGEQLRAALRSA